MVDGQHNLTRRALLGAVCAAPLLPSSSPRKRGSSLSAPAPPPDWTPDQVRADERWAKALARFEKTDAALAAVAHSDDEALYGRLGARHDTALRRLLRTPAPDLPELALKLDLALDDRAVEYVGDAAPMKALKRDARRLAARSS